MTRQYKRAIKLTVEGIGGELDLSKMHIRFSIRQGDKDAPASANIRVSNLSDKTAQAIPREFRKVSLQAGYEDDIKLVFTGEIIQVRIGRESSVETYCDIIATNSDRAYNFAVVNTTLAAGHTFRDQVEVAWQAMQPYGVEKGFIDDLGAVRMPRARTLFGMARDVLREIGFATNTVWSIQQDKLQLVKAGGYLPGQVVVLNSRTGLIGLPVQTIDGIHARCLLNPNIRPAGRVKVDQASVQQAPIDVRPNTTAAKDLQPGIAADGIYKVLVVDLQGDTRGVPWYCDLTCIRADGPLPPSLSARGISDGST